MSDLVGNPEDRFSHVAAQIIGVSVAEHIQVACKCRFDLLIFEP